jgi:hypothetical protein
MTQKWLCVIYVIKMIVHLCIYIEKANGFLWKAQDLPSNKLVSQHLCQQAAKPINILPYQFSLYLWYLYFCFCYFELRQLSFKSMNLLIFWISDTFICFKYLSFIFGRIKWARHENLEFRAHLHVHILSNIFENYPITRKYFYSIAE